MLPILTIPLNAIDRCQKPIKWDFITHTVSVSSLAIFVLTFQILIKSSMADWSLLPKDLLYLIAQCFETPFDTMRFRSVCSSWRSVVSPRRHRSPGRFPFLPNHGISDTTWGFYLTKRSVFRIGSPMDRSTAHSNDWLIKVEEDVYGRNKLANPLSKSSYTPLPKNFPKVLDLLIFPAFELCQEFVLHYLNFWPVSNRTGDASDLYREKVAYKCLNYDGSEFVLITIHVSGKLAMFKSGDGRWSMIPHSVLPYDDVMLFKGEFYAVDNSGATFLVESQDKITLVAEPVFGGDKKILVESNGELFLVDMYLTIDSKENFVLDDKNPESILHEKTVGFKVFKLRDDGSKKWIVVRDLGDTILFLGENCSFSASASGLSRCKGNCIVFIDGFPCPCEEDDGEFKGSDIAIFCLEDGSISPLSRHAEYSLLFWPPPHWITSMSGS
ncbi:F-box protein SKIP23-like [Cucurbita maxima]|uniref:F-box protein SKIP23-like n=1 Tax=Cucurbita maxima TaxID=3661 RepID=A0A6J1I249_CUCMA|nr:F-box protein SKIP23-like [Cucurbita maxima]